MRGLPGMSFFKGIRGKQAPEVKKDKPAKKSIKSVKMAKMKKGVEDRSTHYDDERKKGEVGRIHALSVCLSVYLCGLLIGRRARVR